MRDLDQIITRLSAKFPDLRVKQLLVRHPGADDDGLWFLSRSGHSVEIQIESPNGMCPFLIESDDLNSQVSVGTTDQAVEILSQILGFNLHHP